MTKGRKTERKPAQTAAPEGKRSDAVTATDPEYGKALTAMAVSGSFNGMAVIEPFQKNLAGKEVTADALIAELRDRLKALQAGDMTHVESMLLSQATALQTIFASLARKAATQEYLKQYQTHLTLALKAQAQSRATLEALIELKHPRHPPTFVKQANIAHGPQQVNNGTANSVTTTRAGAHAGQLHGNQNELLEAPHERLDTRAKSAAGAGHTRMEAVGAVHRPDDS